MLRLSLCTPPKARWLAFGATRQVRLEGCRLFADGELIATHEEGHWFTRNHQEFLILQADFDAARISIRFESAESESLEIGPFARVRIVHAAISAGWPVEMVLALFHSETNCWSLLNHDGSFDTVTIAIDPIADSGSHRHCAHSAIPMFGRPAKARRRELAR